MSNQGEQGTGRHPPGRRDSAENVRASAGRDRADASDPRSRESRGRDGEIHSHTTRAYERDHPGKSR
jgi:hypothetical protein